MNEVEQRAIDAVRLMRLVVDQAIAEGRGERAEDLTGVTVVPAGVDLDTSRNHVAVDLLLQAEALVRDDDTDRMLANVDGDPQAFKITQNGIDLLRKTGA